jgi:hypothetical protein
MTANLKDRAVLVRFTDRAWRGGMIDKKAGDDVAKMNKAKKNVGHFWKRLVPKAAINPRANAGMAARAFHLSNTLPWMEGGVRILPVMNFDDYMAGMRKLIAKAQAEEKKLFKDYNGWIAEAKRTHGKLFNRDHFPSLDNLRDRFGIEIDVIPLPSVTDWRVDLSDERVKELRKEAELKFAAIQHEGIAEMYERLKEMLEHAKERLGDPEAIFRDSLHSNIKEMVGLLAKLNVSGDKGLEEIRKEIDKRLVGTVTGPDELRTNPLKRKQAAKAAGEIMKKMAAYMGQAK